MYATLAGASVAVLVACGDSDPPIVQYGATPTAQQQPSKSLKTEMAGDDVFHVGADVAPGTWHTDGPRAHGQQHFNDGRSLPIAPTPCVWAVGRLKTMFETTTLASDVPYRQDWGPCDVTLLAGWDFSSQNCRTWHLVKPPS